MATEQTLPQSGEALISELVEKRGSEREALPTVFAAYVDLLREYELTLTAVSVGYSRGWHHRDAP
ncbi:hypothetical protein [Neoaquamicrobium sediminum]|uniref:hypothetical protein n=1 Tax=Neoaquamicrobium sediminum TaxID=1849104 RepID=UPI0015662163|nr:hypothetical protein [Mesorhizobium sediminum]NRC55059.1 hypothetical protein [Mesorhizobium sediminum]